MPKVNLRVRCPLCGGLSYQDRLDREWDFEFVEHRITGLGRGRGFLNTFAKKDEEEDQGFALFLAMLAGKLDGIAARLRGKAKGILDRLEVKKTWETVTRDVLLGLLKIQGSSKLYGKLSDLGSRSGVTTRDEPALETSASMSCPTSSPTRSRCE